MAKLTFDASAVLDVLPSGVYEAEICEVELKVPRSNIGEMLVLTLRIVSGIFAGRTVRDHLMLVHPNQAVVDIAKRRLTHLCRAVGIFQLNDAYELKHRPFRAVLSWSVTSTGDRVNRVHRYLPVDVTPATEAHANHAVQTDKAQPPWACKAR